MATYTTVSDGGWDGFILEQFLLWECIVYGSMYDQTAIYFIVLLQHNCIIL